MSDFDDTPSTAAPDLDALLAEPPLWPKVIGIISIVWAALGLTCGGCGVVGVVSVPFILEAAQQSGGQDVGEIPPSMQFGALDYGVLVIGLALAVLLLVAGITTLARKPSGRMMHLVYAGVSIPIAAISAYNAFEKVAKMNQWVIDNPDSPFAGPGSSGPAAMAGPIFGIILGIAYPVFLLVWFGVIKKKPEDMTGTGLPPAA